jgi:hypothetical protein
VYREDLSAGQKIAGAAIRGWLRVAEGKPTWNIVSSPRYPVNIVTYRYIIRTKGSQPEFSSTRFQVVR